MGLTEEFNDWPWQDALEPSLHVILFSDDPESREAKKQLPPELVSMASTVRKSHPELPWIEKTDRGYFDYLEVPYQKDGFWLSIYQSLVDNGHHEDHACAFIAFMMATELWAFPDLAEPGSFDELVLYCGKAFLTGVIGKPDLIIDFDLLNLASRLGSSDAKVLANSLRSAISGDLASRRLIADVVTELWRKTENVNLWEKENFYTEGLGEVYLWAKHESASPEARVTAAELLSLHGHFSQEREAIDLAFSAAKDGSERASAVLEGWLRGIGPDPEYIRSRLASLRDGKSEESTDSGPDND